MQSNVDPQTVLNYMREQCTDLSMKINTMDLDKTEHELVINALEPLPADRKCYRMIGSVVVERTVGEVLPAVKKNRELLGVAIARDGTRPSSLHFIIWFCRYL